MTNYEKNKEWFDEHELGIKLCGRGFGVDKKTKKPTFCSEIQCIQCEFNRECLGKTKEEWLKAEAKEDWVDWDAVQKDALIEVNHDGTNNRYKRHFAFYSCHTDRVFFFTDGDTSKTTDQISWEASDNVRLCENERGEE